MYVLKARTYPRRHYKIIEYEIYLSAYLYIISQYSEPSSIMD